jgi:succinate dehydrogenase / fumarate reductase cytochrome b subunit
MQAPHQTSVGKKIAMAASGVVLLAFVVGHMLGNLKVFAGEAHFNAYAVFLRTVGEPALPHGALLWIARALLLASVVVHGVAAAQVWRQSRRARTIANVKNVDLSFSYASRTMRWGGVIIGAFVVYHVLHLTFGVAHPDFVAAGDARAWEGHVNAYRNVVAAFRVPWVAGAYAAAMVPLVLHLYHGLWSALQTLAVAGERVERWRRPAAAVVAALVGAGNVSIPIAVLFGWVG